MGPLRVDDVDLPAIRRDEGIVLLPFRDNLFGLHRGLEPFLEDQDAEVMDTGGKAAKASDVQPMADDLGVPRAILQMQ